MNLIQEKSYHFAITVIQLFKEASNNRDITLFRQLLKSGTSVGANIEEAHGAQSQKDFILKMSIAQKEAKESKYWINLLVDTEIIDPSRGTDMLTDIKSIVNILSRILITAKKNLNNSGNHH